MNSNDRVCDLFDRMMLEANIAMRFVKERQSGLDDIVGKTDEKNPVRMVPR
jgi:hypothetical protein